ncbi:MAG TPA: 2-amino-4-hydroxy-6-hydroxymethyldihydropteridine diphosphokinase [Candidatus Kapabacteria bacterium]|mgnify:CR=1 FL=1|nr:2-amino-4-hydroxy-6-hydroxymethyldihydropteridine diphosphokinase [Candidatus Kapabacteria bacterium]HRI31219.1 2-amino-4-hydroxy-6-hydroxymethyldihydropteridine diphosphokinase [Candidatus Kapabacteria bacterium]HRK59177.1 2-amino-4-hydroxy-6-hydroxymethyldihydropteridine diphosphokinase [Candidatus Kapabacteria bacterium]
MAEVVLSLGANLGNRAATLRAAISMMQETAILTHIVVSPLYETEPVGYTEQPSFLNCAVRGVCVLDPNDLAFSLRAIEHHFGRQSRPRWHERELDIDIILFGNTILSTEHLCIPHPRMTQRRFVLQPITDIAASMRHPILGKTMEQLLEECADTHAVTIYTQQF